MLVKVLIGAIAVIMLSAVAIIIKISSLRKDEQEKMGVSLKGQGR